MESLSKQDPGKVPFLEKSVGFASRKGTLFLVLILLLCILSALGYWRWAGQLPRFLLELLIDRIRVPPGFTIQLYATHVPNARSMETKRTRCSSLLEVLICLTAWPSAMAPSTWPR
jgi:hypothetical protein